MSSVKRKSIRRHTKNAREEIQVAERPWGTWTVLKEGTGYKVKLIEVSPGHRLSLQFHQHRSEHWVVIEGKARVVIGDEALELTPFESAIIPVGAVHRLENPWVEPLIIVEIQKGEILREEDIVRLEDDYARVKSSKDE